ncbi:MAG: hypothetical protein EOP53_20615 [Sphingobacteriales bacterium]|nr:MAG: hypothetical protein EOP53_20615 [Sphingobacteriales bacterium]
MENENPKQKSRMAEVPGHVKDFIKTKLAYFKLAAIEGGASAASGAVLGMGLFFLGLFFFIFITIAAAIGIGYLVNNMALGFLIMAIVFLLLAVLLFTMRKKLITNPITKILITSLAGDKTDDEDEKANN